MSADDTSPESNMMQDFMSKLLALAAAYLAMQLLVSIFRRRHRHKTFERMQVPGTKPHPIHGHLYETRRQPYVKFAHKMHEKFGKTVGIYLGGDPYLMTKDLDLIQQVFVSKSRIFYDRMHFYLNIDPVPDNLICQRGDRWRYMRRLLTPAFSNSKIKSSYFYRDTEQTVAKFIRQLETNAKRVTSPQTGQVTRETFVEDSYDRMAAVALDVIVKTAFHMDNMISLVGPLAASYTVKGKSVDGSDCGDCGGGEGRSFWRKPRAFVAAKQDAFLETAKRACRLAFNPLVELIFCFPFLDVPLTFLCNHLYFGSIIQLLFDRLDYLVRRPALASSAPKLQPPVAGEAQQQQRQRRIIDSLIEVLREKKITRSEFTGNAFVIVFAGFETTANALTFTLWLLAKHERVQEKLRHELRSRMARLAESANCGQDTKTNNDPQQQQQPAQNKQQSDINGGDKENTTDAQLAELATGCEYLEMVINESLRLYPPVPGLSCRQAAADCTLANGLHIEKGVNVIPSVFSIHRDKSIWGEQANEFKPERFEVLDVAQLNSAMFMPFGLGPRNCIGKGVAMHEMKIVIGRLMLEYSVQLCPGITPDKLKLCSPINITMTNAEKIGLNFVKL